MGLKLETFNFSVLRSHHSAKLAEPSKLKRRLEKINLLIPTVYTNGLHTNAILEILTSTMASTTILV